MTVIKTKQTRKDLVKSPDAFMTAATDAAGWVQEHKNLVLGLIIGTGALVLALWGVLTYMQRVTYASSSLYLAAAEVEQAEVVLPTDASTDAPTASGQRLFGSRQEKQQAVATHWQKLIDDYRGHQIAQLARLRLGAAMVEAEQWDQAAAAYEEFITSAEPGELLRFVAFEQLGYLAERKQQYDLAIAHFARLAEPGQPIDPEAAYFHEGRIRAQRGEHRQAAALFERVIKEYPASEYRRRSEVQRALLPRQALAAAQGGDNPAMP